MKARIRRLVGMIGVTALLSACMPTAPAFDNAFSSSVRTLVAEQTLNPSASQTNANKVPEGLDGRAARETMERYQRSFEQAPRQVNPFVIGVGGGAESSR